MTGVTHLVVTVLLKLDLDQIIFQRQTQSAEKLLDKYNTLAKEAMVSGDKTLAENYFQHADHFMRVVEDKNKNKVETKISSISELPVDEKAKLENNVIKQEESVKNNKE